MAWQGGGGAGLGRGVARRVCPGWTGKGQEGVVRLHRWVQDRLGVTKGMARRGNGQARQGQEGVVSLCGAGPS